MSVTFWHLRVVVINLQGIVLPLVSAHATLLTQGHANKPPTDGGQVVIRFASLIGGALALASMDPSLVSSPEIIALAGTLPETHFRLKCCLAQLFYSDLFKKRA